MSSNHIRGVRKIKHLTSQIIVCALRIIDVQRRHVALKISFACLWPSLAASRINQAKLSHVEFPECPSESGRVTESSALGRHLHLESGENTKAQNALIDAPILQDFDTEKRISQISIMDTLSYDQSTSVSRSTPRQGRIATHTMVSFRPSRNR